MEVGILYTVYHYYTSSLALCMQITKAHFVQYELTFWFMYLVYVLDFAVFFGSEIVGILTVCGFGAGRWYKILTVGVVSHRVGRNSPTKSRG